MPDRVVPERVLPDQVQEVLDRAALAVSEALTDLAEWDEPAGRRDQYACDVAADAAAFAVLDGAGFGVVSEERAAYGLDRDIVVVVDPVDGTANAIRGIPYYATSLCAIDASGPVAALVVNLATGTRFTARRGGGARRDGVALRVAPTVALSQATVALCGPQRDTRPWRHMRAFGATALELCDVAQGVLDAYVNTDDDVCAPWDYLGGLLIAEEAGAVARDGRRRPLHAVDPAQRRSPLVAATSVLLDEVTAYAWPRGEAS